ncbi:MAG: PD-(D/E)XK nuclease family protein [Chthoniobacterales bacterium]
MSKKGKGLDSLGEERRVVLHLGAAFLGAWENVLLPWLESVARSPLTSAPSAVVTPSRSLAYLLRSKLLAQGISVLGLKFLSPAQLRESLLPGNRKIPLREHLRLLLAISAERLAAKEAELIAKSIARDPDHFLRSIDQLYAAGWNREKLDEPALREVAQNFEKIAHDCGFEFVHEADRAALTAAAKSPPIFSSLLVTGFNGAHWPLWSLLRAAVTASTEATVILNDPRDEARDLDETWVGTWEETFGAAQPIDEAECESVSLLEDLRRLPETKSEIAARAAHPVEAIHFLVGRDTPEQARAIVALTAKFLHDPKCERIGLLFPRAGALPRIVAKFLESARIAHNDGLAHLGPSAFDDDAWRAWLELQKSPRLNVLLKFLRATSAKIFERLSIPEVEDLLRRAYGDVLIDNIDLLREYCARPKDSERHAALVRGLEKIQFLPESARLSEFLAQTHKIFNQLGWKQHWSEVDRLTRTWSGQVGESFSKNLYLRWLGEVLGAPSLQRDDWGAHPYSRVQLLPYPEAEGQTWSHLIFAGLNEEAWPTLDDESGFVRDEAIEDFNRRNRVLNQRAVRRGRQGEGQWSVRENHTLILGANERRQIRRRQLSNLIESTTQGIGVTANLYSESSASRIANPSELFSRLYFAARGDGVSQQTLQALEKQTRDWLQDWSPVDAQKIDSINLGRTRYAYDARRQLRAASEYEFALRTPPDRPISLRVTDWEQALRWPALVWMKIFLGVEANDEGDNAWAIATGQWVHRWLAEGAGQPETNEFVSIPETKEIRASILQSAREFRARVEALCATCTRPLPDWWFSGWSNALYIADSLAAKLSDLTEWSRLASEWKLDSPTNIPLGESENLRVRGRIDLVLACGEKANSGLGFPELWIVDYKTGRQRGFNLRDVRKNETPAQKFHKQLVEGRGVQLALYALAAHALGAETAHLTLLATTGEMRSQFRLEDALAQQDFWRELLRMQESGVFGMLGPLRNQFGFGRDYPLATLAVDPLLLKEKWAITHPALASETEEEPDRE